MVDIKRYEFEIMHIFNELENLEEGHFYEAVKKPGIASAKTIARNLKGSFLDLVKKIAEDKEGAAEMLQKFKY